MLSDEQKKIRLENKLYGTLLSFYRKEYTAGPFIVFQCEGEGCNDLTVMELQDGEDNHEHLTESTEWTYDNNALLCPECSREATMSDDDRAENDACNRVDNAIDEGKYDD